MGILKKKSKADKHYTQDSRHSRHGYLRWRRKGIREKYIQIKINKNLRGKGKGVVEWCQNNSFLQKLKKPSEGNINRGGFKEYTIVFSILFYVCAIFHNTIK